MLHRLMKLGAGFLLSTAVVGTDWAELLAVPLSDDVIACALRWWNVNDDDLHNAQ